MRFTERKTGTDAFINFCRFRFRNSNTPNLTNREKRHFSQFDRVRNRKLKPLQIIRNAAKTQQGNAAGSSGRATIVKHDTAARTAERGTQ